MTPRRLFVKVRPLAGAVAFGALAAGGAYGQVAPRGGEVLIPESSQEELTDIGIRAHTNLKMFVPRGGMDNAQPPSFSGKARPEESPPYSGYLYETPASLGCVYKLVSTLVPGCNPNGVSSDPTGGSRAIAIVDAYHYPTATQDLQVFSAQFGLPAPTSANFQVVYASGRQPPVNAGWNLEEALDIEWAHAMAPNAKIYLVEAASNNWGDLFTAISVAGSLVASAGGGEVSMSFGGSEFSSETYYDVYFTHPGVVYFASAGDSPGVIWPSASSKVVSVGGTSISRNPTTGAFQQEMAWQSSGGGPSLYEPRPSDQNGISTIVGTRRGTPDVAADADPSTGVWIYSSSSWYIVGGTSVAAPVWAGIVNSAGSFSASSPSELATVYANMANGSDFTDIVHGSCGPNEGYLAVAGWDFCTGVGSPAGKGGK
ncbi:MAG TPA: S53 family peptidase [Stellaceae bacterium]|nr:S53 family peptidase [Stellaceae bacterium]